MFTRNRASHPAAGDQGGAQGPLAADSGALSAGVTPARRSTSQLPDQRVMARSAGWLAGDGRAVRRIAVAGFVAAVVAALPVGIETDGVAVQAFAVAVPLFVSGRRVHPRRRFCGFQADIAAISFAALIAAGTAAIIGRAESMRGPVAVAWGVALVAVAVVRLASVVLPRQRSRRAVIVGSGEVAAKLMARSSLFHQAGIEIVSTLGVGNDDPQSRATDDPRDIPRIARDLEADVVIFAFAPVRDHELVPVLRSCAAAGLDVLVVPRLFEVLNGRSRYGEFGGLPVLELTPPRLSGATMWAKGAFDRTVAGLILLFLSPLWMVIAAAVRLSSPGPILFRQRRVGRDGRVFTMFKFRSMVDGAVSGQLRRELIPDDGDRNVELGPGGPSADRTLTRVGGFLRRTSMDELPQLINVLRGEMSLVGPRPERPEYVDIFGDQIRCYGDRHRVKSGVTGWAQVHGLRGRTSLKDRIEMDNYYIENWSLKFDFRILLMTLPSIVRQHSGIQ
jgi:exopolysaccharide biosynthesis polyprenyl glycosylphosphotransferase